MMILEPQKARRLPKGRPKLHRLRNRRKKTIS